VKIAICDDEGIHIEIIETYLNKHKNTIDLESFKFSSGESLLASYQAGSYFDLIYLDIKMDKLSGIDTAKEIRKIDKKVLIIFITSMSEYVFYGYEVRAFYFIIKPVKEEQFCRLFIQAYHEHLAEGENIYTFKFRDSLLKLSIDEIIYLESDGRKINLFTSDNKYSFYGSIPEEMRKLKNHFFILVHRCILVNMKYINRINKNDILLQHVNQTIPLSKKRYKEVYDEFVKYITRRIL